MRAISPWDQDRTIGAVTAVGLAVVIALAAVSVFGIDLTAASDQPHVILACLAFFAIIGWWAGRAAGSGGWGQAAVVGIGVGVAWWPIAVVVLVLSSFIDTVLRGASQIFSVGAPIVWVIYGVMVSVFYMSIVGIPTGVVWALATRWLATRLPTSNADRSRPRHPGAIAVGALVVIALSAGAANAASGQVPGTRCLDLDGERPLDGAFSPSGDRLVVVTSNDLNEGGTIHLLAWPSGEELAAWPTWVDRDVVVGPDGRVYWSAWEAEPPWRSGLMTAAVGSAPEWLATGDETGLWNLTWTTEGLRGMTSNTHRAARVRLDGGADPEVERLGDATVGSFWASPDDRIVVTSPEWGADHVTVTYADGSSTRVPVLGDPRSVALSTDRTAVIVGSWFGGTRRYDIATGASRSILGRSQTWIAVSSQGDLAWADDEQLGPGRACVAPAGR